MREGARRAVAILFCDLVACALVEQRGAITMAGADRGCVVGVRGDDLLPDDGTLRVAMQGDRTVGA